MSRVADLRCDVCVCQIVNHHLLKDLTELGLWNSDMKNQLIASNGSIQVQLSKHGSKLDYVS